jgi:hypothetical protein
VVAQLQDISFLLFFVLFFLGLRAIRNGAFFYLVILKAICIFLMQGWNINMLLILKQKNFVFFGQYQVATGRHHNTSTIRG